MIYILGAGAMARETLGIYGDLGRHEEVGGFVEKDPARLIAGEADRPSYEKVARRFFGDEFERSVHFLGAVHGPMLKALYGGAEMLVLPSYSENFGNVVLEALACGTPVLTTTGTPWKLLQERNFGRWVLPTVDGIAEGLVNLLNLGSAELRRMGSTGREHVLKHYSWYRISEQLCQILKETV